MKTKKILKSGFVLTNEIGDILGVIEFNTPGNIKRIVKSLIEQFYSSAKVILPKKMPYEDSFEITFKDSVGNTSHRELYLTETNIH